MTKSTKELTKEIQKIVGTDADGIWGPATASAVLKALSPAHAYLQVDKSDAPYIAIDIGHANGTGAKGNGLEEHEVCAKLGGLLRHSLEAAIPNCRVKVFDFPDLSNSDDLVRTARAINSENFDFSISLHCDSSDSPSAKGAHVIYKSNAGKRLAVEIADKIIDLLPGRSSKIVCRTGLYILNEVNCPAVLIENGFLTNPDNADFLRNRLRELAEAITAGVVNYIHKD